MSSQLRELLYDAAGQSHRDLDVNVLMQTAHQRSRRRRWTMTGLVVAIILALAGGTWAAINGSASNPSVHVAGRTRQLVTGPGASLAIPPGWTELPRVDTTRDPAEILVVGTRPRPATGPIVACTPEPTVVGGSAVYVSIYAYAPTDKINQALPTIAHDGSTVMLEAAVPQPMPFSVDGGLNGNCVAGGQPPVAGTVTTLGGSLGPAPALTAPGGAVLANHFREFLFTDRGRIYDARVVAVGDPSEQLLAEGIVVLNTLEIAH